MLQVFIGVHLYRRRVPLKKTPEMLYSFKQNFDRVLGRNLQIFFNTVKFTWYVH